MGRGNASIAPIEMGRGNAALPLLKMLFHAISASPGFAVKYCIIQHKAEAAENEYHRNIIRALV